MSSTSQDHRASRMLSNFSVTMARDVIAVGVVGLILLLIHELASPFVRGFQCSDDTIRYPYKDSTVSSLLCYLMGSGLNVLLIIGLEFLTIFRESNDLSETEKLKLYAKNVYCRLIVWFFGAVASELLTDISKVTAGRLRPHFLAVCEPEILTPPGYVNLETYCNNPANLYTYITQYRCMGESSRIRDTRMSFMSGHSSYSAYSATFAALYLQSSMNIDKFGLVKPALQVFIASAAFYTGLTRVSDYKHHWQDVLAGLIQGTIMATVVSRYLWPSFYKTYSKYPTKRSSDEVRAGEELNPVSY